MSLISVPLPAAMSDRPFYEEWWFLLVMALVGLILILVLVFTLLLHGHSSKYKACGTGAWLWCFRGVRAAGCIKLCSNKDTCLFSFIIKWIQSFLPSVTLRLFLSATAGFPHGSSTDSLNYLPVIVEVGACFCTFILILDLLATLFPSKGGLG